MSDRIRREDVKSEERRNATGLRKLRYRTLGLCRRTRHRAVEAPQQIRWGYQRVVRGWDDRATWSLDTHLGRTLGAQLTALADGHGCPDGYGQVRWEADLKRHGQALLGYGEDKFDIDDTPLYGSAQDALRWVADNLGSLWD